MENREWQCFSLLSIFFPLFFLSFFSSCKNGILFSLECYGFAYVPFLWHAYSIHHKQSCKAQTFSKNVHLEFITLICHGCIFPLQLNNNSFFSFQIFDTGFDMMSLAIKPHEILSLLMTDLITFCLYGIRNLVMGNLQADRVLWKTFNRSKNHNCYCSLLLLVCHFESNWEFYSSTSKNYKWWRRSLAMYHFESW